MPFACLKKCDCICLNTYFAFLLFPHLTSASATARPGAFRALESALRTVRAKADEWDAMPAAQRPVPTQAGGDTYRATADAFRARIGELEAALAGARRKAQASPFRGGARIVQRHHFSSALQRMSVVACVNESGAGSGDGQWYCCIPLELPHTPYIHFFFF